MALWEGNPPYFYHDVFYKMWVLLQFQRIISEDDWQRNRTNNQNFMAKPSTTNLCAYYSSESIHSIIFTYILHIHTYLNFDYIENKQIHYASNEDKLCAMEA